MAPEAEWARQDAELDAEIAALEASGPCPVPSVAELDGLAPDLLAGPPEGELGWLADLPGPLLEEYLDVIAEPAGPSPIAAGWWDRAAGDGGGFAAGGVADELPPGPVLAGLAGDVCAGGLDRLTDDELVGVLRAGRRLESWSASVTLATAGELMRRRLGQEMAGQAGAAEHADAELAAALTLTGRAAGRLLDLALALERLPLTARALAAGVIDMPRVMVIADEVTGLGDEHVAAVEKRVLARAPGQTTTQVRAAARRAVIAADPRAARERTEKSQREARVERWAEQGGTAALAGRDLASAGVFAAGQHLSQLAAALRAAGAAGTMDQLRAQVFLLLLSGQPVTCLPPSGAAPASPAPTGTVNLTMPLRTWLGWSESPGEVRGFGPLDAQDCRSLGGAMAADPRTRWCLTITGEDGRPLAHGCARPRRGPPGPGPGPPPSDDSAGSHAGPSVTTGVVAWVTGMPLQWLETDGCAHRQESASYRPPASLQDQIRIRQQRCAFPGCGRPAERCDLDHTVPYAGGGLTCECNLAPLCRRHHQAKQAPGWQLVQDQPGQMTWRLPSGRSYATSGEPYPA